jgi:hypothetical protein
VLDARESYSQGVPRPSSLNVVASASLLIVTLVVALPSGWYARYIARFVAAEGRMLPPGAVIADVLSVVLTIWTLTMLALVARSFRRAIEPGWFVALIVFTLCLGAGHLEAVHLKTHLACAERGVHGMSQNCSPWLSRSPW